MARFPLVLFDFDGTLADSGAGTVEALYRTMIEMGKEPLPRERLCKFIGPPIWESFAEGMGFHGEALEKAIAVYREIYQEISKEMLSTFPGTEDMLKALRSAGIKTAVATCKREETAQCQARQLEIEDLLGDIVGLNESENRITKADIIMEILRRFDVSPENAVLVGDRLYDGEGAKAVGMPFLAVLYGYGDRDELVGYDPIAFVDSPKALQDYLLK